jgi:hypothetical protein
MNSSSTFDLEAGAIVGAVIYAVIAVVAVWANVRIIRRAGYSGWWILIALVPVVNVVMFLVFAFKEWPIQRELALLRTELASRGGNPSGYPTPGYGYLPPGQDDPRFGNGGLGYGNPPGGYGNPPGGYGNPPSGPGSAQPEPPPN